MFPLKVLLFSIGMINNKAKAANIPTTPPSLLGTERKIAYAKRKYHSGTICAGVDIGLARIKLSGSPSMFGANIIRHNIVKNIIMNPTKSLMVKYQ